MKIIKGKQWKETEIEVSDEEFRLLFINHLLSLIDLPPLRNKYDYPEYSIKDGKLIHHYEEYGGSHSWFETKVIRDVTTLDEAVFDVIAAAYKRG